MPIPFRLVVFPEYSVSNFALQWFPVAVVPASWYRQSSVTLDLGGYIPLQDDPVDTDTARNPSRAQLNSAIAVPITKNQYAFHWRHFGSFDAGYRDMSCTTGSYPYSVSLFVVSGGTVDYFDALNRGIGELNTRPQWLNDAYR